MVEYHPLLGLALILIAGHAFGQASKRLGMPSVTGQILAGILLGPAVLHLFDHKQVVALQPVTEFALGLIAVTVGSHLHLNRVLVARRRLLLLLIFESLLTPFIVVFALQGLFGPGWVVALILAALAVETAPATVLALVKEARAKGVFVRTLMVAVALNNIATLCLFEIAHATGGALLGDGATWYQIVAPPIVGVIGSALLGSVVGLGLIFATRNVVRSDHLTTASLIAILLTVGAGGQLGLSSLLACLFLGLVLANVTPDKEELGDRVFKNFEGAILAVFFTLAGAEVDFSYLLSAGGIAVGLVAARFVGKVLSARLAMQLAEAPRAVQLNLGLALIPQAGLSVGLLLSLQEDEAFAEVRPILLAVGLTSVLLNELIGPLTTRLALRRSGDAGKDRERVIDFLHEENIVTSMSAKNHTAAVAELTDLLWSSHRLKSEHKESFLASVKTREEHATSYVGAGLAIPHGVLEENRGIVGVMGISSEGIKLDSGHKVHCIVLLATPKGQRDRHLEVLAAFARAITGDRNVRHQLYEAQSPAHAYQLLHAEDAEDFNYFLDEEGESGTPEPAPA